MKAWIAILFTLGILAASIAISAVIGFNLTWIMVLGTALWAAIDSSKVRLKRYESGISYGPVVLFFACALLWVVGFPWYLAMRYKIRTGTATIKPGFAEPGASPNGGAVRPLDKSGTTGAPPSVS